MKDYFKKSKVFKTYKDERVGDAIIESHDRESLDAVTGVKHKYVDLMKRYGVLLDKIKTQGDVADKLEAKEEKKADLVQK